MDRKEGKVISQRNLRSSSLKFYPVRIVFYMNWLSAPRGRYRDVSLSYFFLTF